MTRRDPWRQTTTRVPRSPSLLRAAILALLALCALPAGLGQHDAPERGTTLAQAVTPAPTAGQSATPGPPATHRLRPSLDQPGVPVRVQVPSLDIDLAVVSSKVTLRGNPPGYPLCDVAHYWTRFDLPGAPGTAWIYAHAQEGMFLPLLEEAIATDGRGLVGREIKVQLHDSRVLTYRVNAVRQHATDTSIARQGNPGAHRLVLQTSEGVGDDPKLMVAARLIQARFTTVPPPKPRPRLCTDPPGHATPKPTARPARTARPSAEISPEASAEASPGWSLDASPSISPVGSPAPSGRPSPYDPRGDEPHSWPPDHSLLATLVVVGAGIAFLSGTLILMVWLRRHPVT